MSASALCIRFYNNPAPLNGSMQFHYCTDSNPGTGADDAFVLKRGVWRTPHGLHTDDRRQPPVRAIFKSVFSLNILTAYLFTYPLFTQSFLFTKLCIIYFGILFWLECLSNVYLEAGSSLISSRCLSRSILFIAVVCMARFVQYQ